MRRLILLILSIATLSPAFAADDKPVDNSTRKERNYIRQGNSLYNEKRFAEAEVAYRKALEENAASEAAMYNLATSLIRQAGSADPNSGNNPMQEASSLLQNLARSAQDASIAEKAFYNMGNMAFNQQQYDQAINMYKGALRKNPDNDKARQNLRLAQLKRQEQQNQDQNQDNKDQDKDQQDQQDKQDKQDQQDQNKDQNKDQDKQPNQDKKDEQKQQPQQQQGGISNDNANKILKAMENEENATRRKVQEQQKKEAASSSRVRGRQW